MAKKKKDQHDRHDAESHAPAGAGQEDGAGSRPKMKRKEYEKQMRELHGELVAMQEMDARRSSTWVPDSVRCVKGEYFHRIDEIRGVGQRLTSESRCRASIRALYGCVAHMPIRARSANE